MIVSTKQYWSKSFAFICFFPQIVLIALYLMQGCWMMFAFQTIILMLCCFNNYLLCENYSIKKEVINQIQINLNLIDYIKKKINTKGDEK